MTLVLDSEKSKKFRKVADAIKENMEAEGNQLTEKEARAPYFELAPEGIDEKTVKLHSDWNSEYLGGAQLAIGEMAADMFKKDPKMQEVHATLGYADKSSTMNITQSRSKTYSNPQTKEEVVKFNVGKLQTTSKSSKGYGLKSLRNEISEASKDLLK